jgi:hypothetical protein
MKPRTIALIVLTGVAVATAAPIAAGLLVLGLMQQVRPPVHGFAAVPVAPPAVDVAPPGGGVFAFQNLAQPVAPAAACTPEDLQAMRGPVAPAGDCRFSGPFTHANLTVFFIHGPDTAKGTKVLPLQSALAQNLAVVREGGLTVDNRADVPLFIQAGDIVKGGTQDRVLPYDQLVAPGTNMLPLSVFCVESGRSFPRGDELSTAFQSSTEQLPGKRLHLAARYHKSQAEVWQGVRDLQIALARNIGGPVQSPLSQTSLQLTLESPRLQQAVGAYLDELAMVPMNKDDVIGVAVAINGRFQGAEIYATSALFQDLWLKQLRASAVAAVAERQPGAALAVPTVEAVEQFLADAEAGASCQHRATNGTRVLRQESPLAVLFDTCDPAQQNLVLHRSILAK